MQMPSSGRKAWLGTLTDRYHDALLGDEETLSYLDDRGVDFESAISAALGLVREPDPAHGQYEGWLAIPYLTPTGVVAMRFRCLEDHEHEGHGKYESVAGDTGHLFNVPALHLSGSVMVVTEGEIDALVSTASGACAVGVPGATNWKPFWGRLFEDYERVLILGDGDTAGRKFANKVAGLLHNGVARPMPEGHDVSSYVLEHGASSFMEYVQL